jgi:dethiobiotin synthetase
MHNGIFITGTDTGVGKTYVAKGLTRTFISRGLDVGVMKPAETGCRKRAGQLFPRDAMSLRKAAVVSDPLDLINPYRFSRPLAPSVAAEQEGNSIDPARIIHCFQELSRRHDFMIVEGAGGIMTPLSQNYLFLDLAEILRLPVVIVSRPCLGTINHTLLTISSLKTRTIDIAGVVICYAEKWRDGLAEKTNPAVIEAVSGVRVLGIVQNSDIQLDGIANAIMKPPGCTQGGSR